MYRTLIDFRLSSTFDEVMKVVQIILTTPVASEEPDRCVRQLKCTKTFIRNTIRQERLNALFTLSIQKEDFKNIPHYIQSVTERFPAIKTRRAHFLIK